MSINVDTVDTSVFRALPHIGEKVFERLPAIANCDTPTSIVLIVRKIFVSAAGQHCLPRTICSGSFEPSGGAVFESSLTFATAVSALTGEQVSAHDFAHNTTVATTHPIPFQVMALACTQYDPCSELTPGDIDEIGHDDLQLGCSVKWRDGVSASSRCER